MLAANLAASGREVFGRVGAVASSDQGGCAHRRRHRVTPPELQRARLRARDGPGRLRAAPLGGPAPASGAARRPHGSAQPLLARRPCRRSSSAQARPASTQWRRCFWTSTTSKRSTTPWVTWSATSCSRQSATRLYTALREADTVARIGGDEFVVLVGGLSSAHGAEIVAENLLEVIRTTPFHLGGRNVTVTASIGIALGET